MAVAETHEWEIRRGVEPDLAEVLELWRLAGSRPTVTDSDSGLQTLLEHDRESLLIADHGGRIVGTLIVGWDGWRGSFYRLAVDPEWRRRGIAISLVRAGEELLHSRGGVRLTAIVATEETAATAFWAAAGYLCQDDTSRFVRVLER